MMAPLTRLLIFLGIVPGADAPGSPHPALRAPVLSSWRNIALSQVTAHSASGTNAEPSNLRDSFFVKKLPEVSEPWQHRVGGHFVGFDRSSILAPFFAT